MEMAVLLVLGVALMGGAAAAAISAGRRDLRHVEGAFTRIAHRFGGHFEGGRVGFYKRVSPTVEVEIDGACVLVDTHVVQAGKHSTSYTRIRGEYVMPAGPTFRIYREHLAATLGKAFGLEDVVLGGDPEFDEKFVVKADDPASVDAAWTPEARQRMLELDRVTAHSDGHMVQVQWTGTEKDPERLDPAIRIVADLCRHGLWLIRDLAEMLPEARYVAPQGSWDQRSQPSVLLSLPGGTATVAPCVHRGWVVFRLILPCPRKLPRFEVKVGDDGQVQGEVPEGLLSGEAAAAVPNVGEAELVCDGRALRLYFRGPGPDFHERIGAGARLLSEIAAGRKRAGAFR